MIHAYKYNEFVIIHEIHKAADRRAHDKTKRLAPNFPRQLTRGLEMANLMILVGCSKTTEDVFLDL